MFVVCLLCSIGLPNLVCLPCALRFSLRSWKFNIFALLSEQSFGVLISPHRISQISSALLCLISFLFQSTQHTRISCRATDSDRINKLHPGQLYEAVRWRDGVPPPLLSSVLPRTARILRDGVPAVRTANKGKTLNRCGNPKMPASSTPLCRRHFRVTCKSTFFQPWAPSETHFRFHHKIRSTRQST